MLRKLKLGIESDERVYLNIVVREGLSEEVTFEQMLE